MTMTADSRVFLDSNILVYAAIPDLPWNLVAQRQLNELPEQQASFWISRQVVREFLSVVTRPAFDPAPALAVLTEAARRFVILFEVAEDSPAVTAELLGLIENPGARGRQVHDANIVASMRAHGIPNLLTHNTADFRRYEPAITVLPLVVA